MSGKNSEHAFKRGSQGSRFDHRVNQFIEQPIWGIPFALPLIALLCLIPLTAFISTPLTATQQAWMGVGTVLLANWLNRVDGRVASLAMIFLSMLISTRYMYWRLTETLGWGMAHRDWIDTFFSLGLVGAEMYAFIVLFLGYFQVLWPLQRKPVALPKQVDQWPTVDIYIPTFNEPLSVVRPTVLASLEIDWPADRLRIYVLDDGRRTEFRQFCEELGVTHITRADSKHAKAGNLNRAMEKTQGEFIAIFDCDHIPTRSFLQVAMGWMVKDPGLAMMQTPHHFFSPDPFERNLGTFRKVPNEGELFYGLLQDGNDFWNATFFCGSCAVLRRTALEDIGGIAVETVTEDAHTALKMHRKGWNTAYLNLPQAAGLATESLSAHVGQRIRWARGMAQIFRMDNPLIARGLSIGQRLCYCNAMLHFFYGLPRLVFLTAPLSYLFFEAHIIEASALAIAAYAAPHLVHANLTNSRLQGAFRHSFWAEVYETVLATYILIPTTVALINPKLGTFNVTAKGGLVEADYFDRSIANPFLVLLALNLLGFGFGMARALFWNTHELDTVLLNMFWTVYNMVILGAAVAVAWEARQIRRTIRVAVALPARLRLPGGQDIPCTTQDISEGGTALMIEGQAALPSGSEVEVALLPDHRLVWTKAKVVRSDHSKVSLSFLPLSLDQEQQLVFAIFGRADAWMQWSTGRPKDRIGHSFGEVARYGVSGIARIIVLGMRKLVATMKMRTAAIGKSSRRQRTAGAALALVLGVGVLAMYSDSASAQTDEDATQGTRAESRTLTFESMGVDRPVRLRGTQGEFAVPLSIRDDEIVRRARLKLKYAHSPALIFPLSHLNVFMNNELSATIPYGEGTAEGAERVIDLDPRLFVRFNQIGLQFIGHYSMDCENPFHSSLWSIVSNQSTLELDIEPLNLVNDLAMLPQPFFDSRDQRRLVLPIAFAGPPSIEELRAAGVVASWFGSLAAYRGAEFPVYVGDLPNGHGILISSGGRAPDGVTLPEGGGASVSIMVNPRAPDSKLLVLSGSDGSALNVAAKAVALKAGVLSGASALIRDFTDPEPREPYDAPRWLPTDRPVELGELHPFSLMSRGAYPDLIRVPFSLPPDLFTWRSQGLKLDLRYRYTPSIGSKSTLNVNLNNEFVEALALSVTNEERYAENRVNLPFVAQYEAVNRGTVHVPDYKFGAENELQFQFYFEREKEGACRDVVLDNLRGGIDKDSTIDLDGLPHFTYMPDLAKFASSGWPFTRMADLSETAVVLPDTVGPRDIELFLALMGRVGRATGLPAYRVALARADDISRFQDRDLLVLGTGASQPLLGRWADDMPMTFTAEDMRINVIGPVERLRARWEDRDLTGAQRHAGNMVLDASDTLGAIMGLRSPLDGDRSVVVIAASTSDGLGQMANVLSDPGKSQFVRDELVLVSGDVVNHYDLGSRYSMGRLPFMLGLRWWLSHQPGVLVLIALLATLLIAVVLYRVLRRMALSRNEARS